MRLRVDDLAWLAISDRGRPRILKVDHAVMAAINVVREAVSMIVGLPPTINQITKFVPVPDREVDRGAPDTIAALDQRYCPFIPIVERAGDMNPIRPNTRW